MIYFVQRANGDIKIGYTYRLESRMPTLRRTHGNLTVLATIDADQSLERPIHAYLAASRIASDASGTEWFRPTLDVYEFIQWFGTTPDGLQPLATTEQSKEMQRKIHTRWYGYPRKPITILPDQYNLIPSRIDARPPNVVIRNPYRQGDYVIWDEMPLCVGTVKDETCCLYRMGHGHHNVPWTEVRPHWGCMKLSLHGYHILQDEIKSRLSISETIL